MKRVIWIFFFIVSAFVFTDASYDISPSNTCLNIDIILLADYSSSVEKQEHFVVSTFREFAKQFELSDLTMKIGIVHFSSGANLICPLTGDNATFNKSLNDLRQEFASGGTNMYEALTLAYAELFSERARPAYRKMVIIVSDGYPDRATDVLDASVMLKNHNVTICGILINQDSNNPEFMQNVSSDFCYVESDYKNLVNELKKLDICL